MTAAAEFWTTAEAEGLMRRQAAALAQRTCGCFPLDLSAIDTHSAITTVVSVASNIPHCVRSVEWRDLHFGNGDGAIDAASSKRSEEPCTRGC